MVVSDGRLSMSEQEWQQFAAATFATWKPRTVEEFNAMVDLAIARRRADDDAIEAALDVVALDAYKFGPDGEVNFPVNQRWLAYVKVHGVAPTPEQLEELGAAPRRTGLTLVSKG